MNKLKIAIAWSNISGYMAACWKDLASQPDIDLKIWAFSPKQNSQAPFDPNQTMGTLNYTLIDKDKRENHEWLANEWANFNPNALIVPGWLCKGYNKALKDPRFENTKKIMGLDLPWLAKPRQYVATILKRKHANQFDAIWVAGERAYQYAKRITGNDQRIHRGIYAYDEKRLTQIALNRTQDHTKWPKRFIYVGRYVPVKDIQTLVEAYKIYRKTTHDPWELHCCGTGPLAPLLKNTPGIYDHGFVQPNDLPEYLKNSGAFVICSKYEPWGVVIAEALGSGLPVLATQSCGATVELVHPSYNGWLSPPNSPKLLAQNMSRISSATEKLCHYSQNAVASAQGYTSSRWAQQLLEILNIDPKQT